MKIYGVHDGISASPPSKWFESFEEAAQELARLLAQYHEEGYDLQDLSYFTIDESVLVEKNQEIEFKLADLEVDNV